MVNDKKIEETMLKLARQSKKYLIEVNAYNPTSFSDSIIEEVLATAEELKHLYDINM